MAVNRYRVISSYRYYKKKKNEKKTYYLGF